MARPGRKQYRLIQHAGDQGVFARGTSQAETMETAALALTGIILDVEQVEARRSVDVSVEAVSPDRLLQRWLTEILYLFETRLFVGAEFVVELANPFALRARITGEDYDALRHGFKTEVKAITWHRLTMEETPRGWRAFFVVDL